jgi:hypothetical protein
MSTLVSLDPRFPIPDSMSTRDPNHPLQLVKKARELQNQAAADTKYDPLTLREGFRSRNRNSNRNHILILIVGIVGIVGIAAIGLRRTLYSVTLVIGITLLFMVTRKVLT